MCYVILVRNMKNALNIDINMRRLPHTAATKLYDNAEDTMNYGVT